MIERIFSATLTFILLVGGTVAVGAEWFGTASAPQAARHEVVRVELPRVEVIGCRSCATLAAGESTTGLRTQ